MIHTNRKLLAGRWLLILLLTVSISASASAPPKYNVLFIAVDDMNDWISPLKGLTGVKTPNFDRLANMSMLFTNAHCASPACAPSRLSVMTGVHPARSGVMNNIGYDGPQWRKNPVLANVLTIEQFFKKAGYHTLAGGKIYHSLAPPWTLLNQADPDGWDFWFPNIHVPIPYQVRAPDRLAFPPGMKGARPNKYFTWAPLPQEDVKMADYQTVDWARYELMQKQEKPLFLAVGLFKPHMPWEVPQKYFDMYPLSSIPDLKIKENDLDDAFDHGRRLWHKFVLENNQWKNVMQAYMAALSFADAQLGRLLDGLQKSPLKDNTIVVLWSDHGMHMGEKENWEKFTLWERSTHVPLFFMAPGLTKPGTTCNVPVSLLDIYPTLCELIGETPPPNCDGQSLLPLLKGEHAAHKYPVTAYKFSIGSNVAYYPIDTGAAFAIRTERYRYIYYPVIGLEELYDHQTDDAEWDNIAYKASSKKIIAKLRAYMLEQVPSLKWTGKIPEGYHVLTDGSIKKTDFITLDKLQYPGKPRAKESGD
ncbi:sulfatase (plasmid) [Pedobacter sp. BS3]|uniref:sulfatase n=1 Tax=Pedobacter sp. BS3 TaxID=2567937 RepID=UPI0011EF6BA6|nr:sulfatase [Pedobacter sp. BS3]TZF86479.1 sulfatase [Pedobacter sp. BS3]